jgi:hypothetical protein
MPLYEGKSLWTARVSARSKVGAGDRADLGVDTRNLHFFDPASGIAVGVLAVGKDGSYGVWSTTEESPATGAAAAWGGQQGPSDQL